MSAVWDDIINDIILGASKGACLTDLVMDFLATETSKVLVFSAGDDVTDETMFAVCKDDIYERFRNKIFDMISVKVGSGKTRAKYRVNSPVELRQVISSLAQKFSLELGPESGSDYLKNQSHPQFNSDHCLSSPAAMSVPVGSSSYLEAGASPSKPTLASLFFPDPGILE